MPRASDVPLARLLFAASVLLLPALGTSPAGAASVVVPDDYPTIQQAVDAPAETVLVRAGTYDEIPLIDHPTLLKGIGDGARPHVSGLVLHNENLGGNSIRVRGIDFIGRVEIRTPGRDRLNSFSLDECALPAGLAHTVSTDPDEVTGLYIRNCRLGGHSWALGFGDLVMHADTVDGTVAWDFESVVVTDCWFRGAPGTALSIRGTLTDVAGRVSGTRIEDYGAGIALGGADLFTIEGNIVARCGRGIQVGGYSVNVFDNTVVDCGTGIDSGRLGRVEDHLHVRGNTVLRSAANGIQANPTETATIERNVIGHSGGAGVVLDNVWEGVVVDHNTIYRSAGAGLAVIVIDEGSISVLNNVFFENQGWGLHAAPGVPSALACNDWFGNGLGAYSNGPVGTGGFEVDPRFCDVDGDDVTLRQDSPLVAAPGCGLVGARDQGCAPNSAPAIGAPAFALTSIVPSPASGPIEIAWSLSRAGEIDLAVLDIAGRTVASLVHGHSGAGAHTTRWDGRAGSGAAPPGVYLVRLRHDGRAAVRSVILLR